MSLGSFTGRIGFCFSFLELCTLLISWVVDFGNPVTYLLSELRLLCLYIREERTEIVQVSQALKFII